MENLEKFYINGRWVTPNSTETMPVLNPATEQKIGRITLGNGTDVDRAVAAALIVWQSKLFGSCGGSRPTPRRPPT